MRGSAPLFSISKGSGFTAAKSVFKDIVIRDVNAAMYERMANEAVNEALENRKRKGLAIVRYIKIKTAHMWSTGRRKNIDWAVNAPLFF